MWARKRRNGSSARSSELRRPELVFPYSAQDRGASSPRPRSEPSRRSAHHGEKWGALDVLLLVYAALRIMLPYTLVILGGAAAAYGLFMLAFG